jgi:hypothetical protein
MHLNSVQHYTSRGLWVGSAPCTTPADDVVGSAVLKGVGVSIYREERRVDLSRGVSIYREVRCGRRSKRGLYTCRLYICRTNHM